MIETFKDRTTGEIFHNQTVLCEFYVFWREDMLREQDKAPNVGCVLTGDWSGIRLADDKQRVRIEPIRFILPEGNEGRTLEDYLAAEVELPDNISDYVPQLRKEPKRKKRRTAQLQPIRTVCLLSPLLMKLPISDSGILPK